MSLTITDERMTSTATRHTAEPWPVPDSETPPTLWRVSWLPGQYLEPFQAVSAMTIAEAVGAGVKLPGNPRWALVESLAAELGMSGADAVAKVSQASLALAEQED